MHTGRRLSLFHEDEHGLLSHRQLPAGEKAAKAAR